jgi:hypothetical protein
LVVEVMPPFLGFPEQPEFDDEGPHESAVPRLIAGLWVDGDDEDREWIDSILGAAKREAERNFARDYTRMVFGYCL